MKAPLLGACLLAGSLLTGSALAQGQYTFTINQGTSNFTWTGSTSIGPINGVPNNNFSALGTAEATINLPQEPFFTGEFTGGSIATSPAVIKGEIPNPIPILPPLAEIEIRNIRLEPTSTEFVISGGSWTTTVTLTYTQGEAFIDPLAGSATTIPLTGLSATATSSGTISQTGSNIALNVPISATYMFQDPGTGISGDFTINGTLRANASTSQTMNLAVGTLTAGQPGTFDVTNGAPNSATFLAYSLQGINLTPVNQLNIVLGLQSPTQAGPARQSNGAGAASWTLPIPGNAGGLNVWLQAAQNGQTSNVVATSIN